MTEAKQTFGMLPLDIASKLTGLEYVQGLRDMRFPAPPFTEVADIRPTVAERGRITFEGVPSPRFLNPLGVIHGGWVSLLLDTTMGCAVHSVLDAGYAYTTIDLRTTFVKSVRATKPVRCEATLLHAGSRVASAEARLLDADGSLLAHGSQTCLIMRIDTPPPVAS